MEATVVFGYQFYQPFSLVTMFLEMHSNFVVFVDANSFSF